MKHIVMFRLKGADEEKKNLAARFCAALEALPAMIPELKSMKTGVNVNPKESWDVVLIAEGDSQEDIAAYSAHPAHVAAVDIIRQNIDARACVDIR